MPMTDPQEHKLRVACVGAGIGGLTLATALSRFCPKEIESHQLQVDVHESTAKLTEVGAGITILPRGWEIIKQLGLAETLKDKLAPGQRPDEEGMVSATNYRKGDQKEGTDIVFSKMKGGSLSLHRADVQAALLPGISALRLHLSRRLISYEETTDSVILHFADGGSETCDLLVGADGVNSIVRKGFLSKIGNKTADGPTKPIDEEKSQMAKPVWSGIYVYRSLVDSEVIRKLMPEHRAFTGSGQLLSYCGKSKHVVAYPILNGKLLNIVIFISDPEKEGTVLEGKAVQDATNDEIAGHFVGWEEDVQVLIKNMNKPSRWAVQTVRPLDKYAESRVALLGDAAHAMEPHLGNGASQAMEDAYILAQLISKAIHRPKVDIAGLLNAYSAVRQPFGNFVVQASRRQGRLYEFNGPGFEDYVEGSTVSPEKIKELGDAINEGWEWTWKTKVADDLERALAFLD